MISRRDWRHEIALRRLRLGRAARARRCGRRIGGADEEVTYACPPCRAVTVFPITDGPGVRPAPTLWDCRTLGCTTRRARRRCGRFRDVRPFRPAVTWSERLSARTSWTWSPRPSYLHRPDSAVDLGEGKSRLRWAMQSRPLGCARLDRGDGLGSRQLRRDSRAAPVLRELGGRLTEPGSGLISGRIAHYGYSLKSHGRCSVPVAGMRLTPPGRGRCQRSKVPWRPSPRRPFSRRSRWRPVAGASQGRPLAV